MGCMCIDVTSILGPSDDRAPNTCIPKPGTPDQLNKNPSILFWHCPPTLPYLDFNLQIDHPHVDLLMLPNDILSAFHQLFYHPWMIPMFASIFEGYLCIPEGTIFGQLPWQLHALGRVMHMVSWCSPFWGAQVCLLDYTLLPPALSPVEVWTFAPAILDAFNPGATHSSYITQGNSPLPSVHR